MWKMRQTEAAPSGMPRRARPAAWLSLALWALLSCGGGVDSGGTGATPASVTVGTISGFGSIIVGGIHHDESMAQIVDDDGQPSSAQALQLGVTATIEGSAVLDTGLRRESKAERVRVVERLVGPLESVAPGALSLTVLGQRVVVTAATVFDARLVGGLAALPMGTVLAVFGQLDVAASRIVATRIEPRPLAPAFVVHAAVSRYDRAARRLTLGGLDIDLATISEPNLPAALAMGSVARVKLQPMRLGALWLATGLRATALELGDRDNVEIEGRISQFTTAETFSVDGVPVDARAAMFPNGRAGLAIGARVEVQGRAVNGTLIARRVAVEADDDAGELELEGTISAIDTAAQTFVVRGTTVSYAGTPRFEGGTAGDLALNRRVRVKGALSADRTRLQASEIRIDR